MLVRIRSVLTALAVGILFSGCATIPDQFEIDVPPPLAREFEVIDMRSGDEMNTWRRGSSYGDTYAFGDAMFSKSLVAVVANTLQVKHGERLKGKRLEIDKLGVHGHLGRTPLGPYPGGSMPSSGSATGDVLGLLLFAGIVNVINTDNSMTLVCELAGTLDGKRFDIRVRRQAPRNELAPDVKLLVSAALDELVVETSKLLETP